MMRRLLQWTGMAAAVGAAGALGYAVGIEPYQVEIARLDLYAPHLPEEFNGYRVLQVSDLHMRQMGRRERIVEDLLQTMPPLDLVAVTGDLIHTTQGIEPFLKLARSFRALDGVAVIFGNSEHKNGVRPHLFAEQLEAAGMTPLLNRHLVLSRGGAEIALAGVDDPVNNKDLMVDALAGIPRGLFTLLLMHSPDGIAEAVVRGVDVVLSGHTHGGQVRFPGVGAPFTHALLGRRMSSGYYAGQKLRRIIGIRPGVTQLYVTRGIGVSGLAMRFLCKPELTLITLRRGVPRVRFHAP